MATLTERTPNKVLNWQSRSPDQTAEWGKALGKVLEPGDVVALMGQLGAGKTHLVRGIAQGAEVPPGEVASPSFAILYNYDGRRLKLHHADLYRVTTIEELYATGYMELPEPGAALLVEWLDHVPEVAPPDVLVVEAKVTGDKSRDFTLRAYGPKATRLLKAWAGAAHPAEG